MASVGAYLRGLREQQGMSVDELSRATRVLHHYLEALESDDVRGLPAPVFTKGFIRAYCQAIGVSAEEALRLYDKIGVPPPDVSKPPVNAVRTQSAPETPRRPFMQEPDYLPVTPPGPPLQGAGGEGRGRGTLLISFILLVVLGAAFFAVTLGLQSGREGEAERSVQAPLPPMPAAPEPVAAPVPTAPEALLEQPPVSTSQLVRQSQTIAPTPSASGAPTPSGAPAAPAAPRVPAAQSGSGAPSVPAAPSAPASPSVAVAPKAQAAPSAAAAPPPVAARASGLATQYRLIARTTEITWMRVRTEDGRISEETIPANEVREWVSSGPFVITIGNAGGVSLELNGRPVPRLGASGSVITRLVLPSDNQ